MANIALDEVEINRIIMDIDDYAIAARKIFGKIEDVVNQLDKDCDAYITARYKNKFGVFSKNFNIMSNNILSYKKDLQEIKSEFKKQQSIASRIVNQHTKNAMNRR